MKCHQDDCPRLFCRSSSLPVNRPEMPATSRRSRRPRAAVWEHPNKSLVLG